MGASIFIGAFILRIAQIFQVALSIPLLEYYI